MYRGDILKALQAMSQDEVDIEDAHIEADKLLCELLENLGYEDVVEAYKEIPKWYS